MVFIDHDQPVVLRSSVNGKPGFMVLPQGEESDELLFTSQAQLLEWARDLQEAAEHPEAMQTFEQWLEDQE